MEGKQIAVKKIVLQIGKKEIDLSVDEAKELRRVLDELLSNQQTVYPLWYWYPHITYGHWQVTCGNTGTLMVSSSSGTYSHELSGAA